MSRRRRGPRRRAFTPRVQPLEGRRLLAAAVFAGEDTATQGSWIGVYGSDGYDLAQGPASLPSYATVAVSGASDATWASGASEARDLQVPGSSGRLAATWYTGTTESFDVHVSDGQAHRVALYALDWDSQARSEAVQIVDDATGAVLDSRTLSSYQQGAYLVWNLSGDVTLKVTNAGPDSAAVSGLFFGNPDVAVGGTATASGAYDSGQTAAAAFDGDPASSWLVGADSGWLQYQFGNNAAYTVTQYQMTSGSDTGLYPSRAPKDWQLLGSDDGQTWTTLDTEAGQADTASSDTRTYTVATPGAYQYYRLNITADNGGGGLTQLAELALLGTPALPPDVAVGGTATASGAYDSGQTAAAAFDGDPASSWLVGADSGWLQYQFANNAAYTVTAYQITSGSDTGLYPNRAPDDWQLLGSDDGQTWTPLDTEAGQADTASSDTRTYTVATPGAYQYYRLNITADNGGGGLTQLAELRLLGTPSAPPDVPPAPTGVTATGGSGEITLGWLGVAGATGYRIERSSYNSAWAAVGTGGAGVTTYTDTGLPEATLYNYRVVATNAAGDSAPSAALSAETMTLAPTGLTLVAVSGARIDLSWVDHSPAANDYYVEESTDGVTWQQIASIYGAATSFAATGPFDGSATYSFRVRADSYAGGYSGYAVASVTTPDYPGPPALNSATLLSDTAAALAWSGVSGATGYRVERSTGYFGAWTPVVAIPADVTSFTDTGLTEATSYTYRVVATNAAGDSAPSGTQTVNTPAASPTGLTLNPTAGNRIDLNWTDHSSVAYEYLVEDSPDGANWQPAGVASSPSANSFTATGPFDGSTTYYFRVRAYAFAWGYSGYATASTTTPAFPNVPRGFTALGVSPTQIMLNWQDDVNETSYRIERSTDGTSWVVVSTPAAGVTSVTDNGLSTGVNYQYRITATNAVGDSGYGGPVSAQPPNTYLPTIVNPAAADPPSGSEKTVALSVLGDVVGGESRLTYSWSVVSAPAGAPGVSFSDNFSNSAKNSSAIFGESGDYTLRVTIANGAQSITSDVSLTVAAKASSIAISPANAYIRPGSTQQFTASVTDQFGQSMTEAVDWSLPPGTPGTIDANGLYTAPTDLSSDDESISVDAAADGVSADSQATVSDRVVINFDDLPVGNVVTNQYADATFSCDPGFTNQVTSDWSPHTIGTYPLSSNGFDRNLYVDFPTPVRGLTFNDGYEDTTGTIGQVRIFQNGQYTTTVPIVGGGHVVVGTVDLSKFINVTRIEIVNITDPNGLVYDNFSFIPGPSVILAWNGDDNQDDLHTYIVDLKNGDVTPRLYDGTFDPAADTLGGDSVSVDWGDSDPADDGSVPHFYDSGQYTVTVTSDYDGNPLTSTFSLDIGHTPNPVQDIPSQPSGESVALDWTPVGGAVSYTIYRGLASDGSDGTFLAAVTESDYDDLTADPDTPYYYHIVANLSGGGTLDLGLIGPGDDGGSGGNAPADAGTPKVTRLGTATVADANDEVNRLYSKGVAEASANNGVYVYQQDVFVLGEDIIGPDGATYHVVKATSTRAVLYNVTAWDKNVFLFNADATASANYLRELAKRSRTLVLDLGGGVLTATLQDGTVVKSQPDGTWGQLIIQRPNEAQVMVRFAGPPIRSLKFRDNAGNNNEIDRIDNLDTLVEEKGATNLLNKFNYDKSGQMLNTEVMWSQDQIYNGLNKRLSLLNGLPPYGLANDTFKSTDLKSPYSGPDQLPTADDLRKVKKVKVEIAGDWPALRAAVNADIDRLQAKYPGFTFTVTFGGNP